MVMMELAKSGGFRLYLELGLTALADRLDVGWGEKLRYLIGFLLQPRASIMKMQSVQWHGVWHLQGPKAWFNALPLTS